MPHHNSFRVKQTKIRDPLYGFQTSQIGCVQGCSLAHGGLNERNNANVRKMKSIMKQRNLNNGWFAFLIAAAGLCAGAAPLHAADGDDGMGKTHGLYFETDAGMNFMNSLGAKTVFPTSSTGYRLDLSMGYAFKITDHLSLAPEVETGILWNSGTASGSDADLLQVPVLVNAVASWHFNEHWVAYAGGGGGLDAIEVANFNSDLVGSELDGAWQMKGGVKYKFGSSAIGLGVKYLSVSPSGIKPIRNTGIFASYTLTF